MNIINIKTQLDNTHYLANDTKKTLYLYVDLKAKHIEKDNERVPLNVALVVDRSGSMSGDKIEYVKKATNFVVENLNASDQLAIVQYDNKIDVVSPSQSVKNKKQIQDLVNKIKARGMTNLSGGMLEGYNQTSISKSNKYVNRVLLLSDGLANEGITSPEKLQSIVQKKFREQGVGLSTFGVGADYDEQLMTNLAEYGGANYYFIDTPDRIPEIFAKELDGLLSVVAQNAKLSIDFSSSFLKCTKVFGYPAMISSSRVDVNFNDVFSEEQKAVLLKFELQRPLEGELEFNVNFSYDDAVEVLDKVTINECLKLSLTEDKTIYQNGVSALTAQNIALFEANDLYEQAMRLVDIRNYHTAKPLVAKAITILETALQSYPTNEELKNQLQQLKIYQSTFTEMESWSMQEMKMAQKTSKMANYMSRKKR